MIEDEGVSSRSVLLSKFVQRLFLAHCSTFRGPKKKKKMADFEALLLLRDGERRARAHEARNSSPRHCGCKGISITDQLEDSIEY